MAVCSQWPFYASTNSDAVGIFGRDLKSSNHICMDYCWLFKLTKLSD